MSHPITTISNFTYDSLNKELEMNSDEKGKLDMFLKAYLDDFWQEGQGSLLPVAQGGHSGNINTVFEKRFVFRNIIRECVSRVAGAFFGKAPNWKFNVNGKLVDRPSKKKGTTTETVGANDLTEIDKALGEFWTKLNVAQTMSKAFESRLAFGRGGVRIFIPTKFKRANLVKPTETPAVAEGESTKSAADTEAKEQFVSFPDIPSAIRAMRVEFIPPTQGRVLDDGGEVFSIVKYEARKNWETKDSIGVIEFSFVDDSNQTFIGTIEERSGVDKLLKANLSSPFKLDEVTTYSEFKGAPYVTSGLYKNNQLANLALTCAGFSLVDTGFGEMVLTNVELETETISVADGETVEVPKRIKRGGAVVNNFMGIEDYDETTGSIKRGTPGVTFRDPVSIDVFKGGYDLAYRACLEEVNQLFALITGDATVSGESRIQALADFILRIMPYKSEVDEQGSWVLTTVLLWAAELASQSMENHSVVFDSRVHVAILSATERQTVMTMREKGVISRETERVLLGIDDPELEAELVMREQAENPNETTVEQFSEKLDVGLKMLSVGIDNETIQKFLGYTDEEVAKMKQVAADNEAALLASIDAANQGGTPPSPADQAAAMGG